MKFLICQIPLQLKSNPFTISNTTEHINIRKKCIEYAENNSIEVIIFPEYSYHPSEYDYLLAKSRNMTIFAGSYQDSNNFNMNMIFQYEKVFKQPKVNLSPFENCSDYTSSVMPATNPSLGYIELENKEQKNTVRVIPLVCFDYIAYYRNQGKDFSYELNKEKIQLVISQCCNDKPRLFFEYAQTHHNDFGFTSIFCNVSSVKVDDQEKKIYGKSSVFGNHSKKYLSSNNSNFTDKSFSNMITVTPEEECLCEIDLQIPYDIQRAVSLEYVQNPKSIKYIKLADI